eukprot:COSAG06_NODE_9406_length_1906_cov_8.678453_3_plen_69_part_01
MEFASRQKCIEHYQNQFPNLPRYMVEMALEYDLQTSKPLTNKQLQQSWAAKSSNSPTTRFSYIQRKTF